MTPTTEPWNRWCALSAISSRTSSCGPSERASAAPTSTAHGRTASGRKCGEHGRGRRRRPRRPGPVRRAGRRRRHRRPYGRRARRVGRRVRRAAGWRTGTVVVVVEPDGERTMFSDRGSATQFTDADDAWLDDARGRPRSLLRDRRHARTVAARPVARRRPRPRIDRVDGPLDVGARRGRLRARSCGRSNPTSCSATPTRQRRWGWTTRAARRAHRRREAGRATGAVAAARCRLRSGAGGSRRDRHDRRGRRARGWIPPRATRAHAPPVDAAARRSGRGGVRRRAGSAPTAG